MLCLLVHYSFISEAQVTQYEVQSPDRNITVTIENGEKLRWSVTLKGQQIIEPSAISLELGDNEILGDHASIRKTTSNEVDTEFEAINYRKAVIKDHYNELILHCRNDFGIIFRAYDDAVAYRFFTEKKGEILIYNEEANFNFSDDYKVFAPYLQDYRNGQKFNASFESLYTIQKISEFYPDSLIFLPFLVDLGNGKKVEIVEADLENYPGMFLVLNETNNGYKGLYAPYPLEAEQHQRNYIPTKRAEYIAKVNGKRKFPWRAIVISEQDKELLDNDIIQKLASANRIGDVSWIKPGQVSWDWWNNVNVSHVDFRAGFNNETYKYYIDFAHSNGIPYIIMDEGWFDARDLTKTRSGINLPEIIEHGNQYNVGVILWAGWRALSLQLDTVFKQYSAMGIKGFKIDFIDRDDQLAVESTYRMAELAARYKLILDYHGVYKPTGLQRTYPNVVGYEGIRGLENFKWADEDMPRYEVTIPYIRNLAGPMDYTPGAMRNANQANFRPINDNPMSKGTRCHQMAMYVVYEAPLQMLSDHPTIYMREQECTDFITSVPVTYDETVPLDGVVGEFVAIARRKGDVWFVGAMTNWTAITITLDLSFLDEGEYNMIVFKDGINAEREGTDYIKEVVTVKSGEKIDIQMAPGGGWTARLEKN